MPLQSLQWPPDYAEELRWRNNQLVQFQQQPELVLGAYEYYREKTAEAAVSFISDWGFTYDPRNAGTDKIAYLPFKLFPRQEEFVRFLFGLVVAQECGLVEKCRDMGATWICSAFSVWLWLYWPGSSIGWGSRKEQLVDKIGDPDSIFEKIRIFINNLPPEFLPDGFSARDHMTHMRIVNPENGSTITGEAGDNIGRGGRKLIYFKDESAHYERPESIEASLMDNTKVQVDMSSVNGMGNVFHRRRTAGVDYDPRVGIVKGRTNVFVMDWRSHPAKSQAWYEQRRKKAEDDGLLHKFAQEVDRDYAGALEGVIIPALHVQSAIDAHLKLRLYTAGRWTAALDVADSGGDTNALALRKSIVLRDIKEWGSRDTGVTTRKALQVLEHAQRDFYDGASMFAHKLDLQYDAIGVGAGVKAEANRLAEENLLPKGLTWVPWIAGAAVQRPNDYIFQYDPNSSDPPPPTNAEFYANLKAQAWWSARRRFELTHRAVTDPTFTWDVDDLVSIPSTLPLVHKLSQELSQPVTGPLRGSMRLTVDKTPDGTKSPNLADAFVMCYFPVVPYEAPVASFGTYGQGRR